MANKNNKSIYLKNKGKNKPFNTGKHKPFNFGCKRGCRWKWVKCIKCSSYYANLNGRKCSYCYPLIPNKYLAKLKKISLKIMEELNQKNVLPQKKSR